jgi:ribosomal protein S18 acetylase RimI-like enzyme
MKGNFTIRFANSRDQDQVQNIARNSFIYSRFHCDPTIPKEMADTIKAEWAHNYFLGKRGDEMVVALVDDMVVGFLLLLRGNNGDLTIDLIAVDERQRGKGIAGNMISYAESRHQDCSRILVGTQVANVASIRLYEKVGFWMHDSKYVLHYHNLPAEGR